MIQLLTPLLRKAPATIAAMHAYPTAANKFLLLVAMVCLTLLALAVLLA
jgi:hypothetical protein